MIHYEITKASPQQLQLQIRYSKENCPDYWINLRNTDFSESNIHAVAKDHAQVAEDFWNDTTGLPEDATLSDNTGTTKPKIYVDEPSFDDVTQEVTFTWVESDDALTQTWTVADKSSDDKAESIRAKRNSLLQDTDHHALSDVAMSTEMTVYRQELRDIPQQTDFPTTVTWPTKPE
tara:strand:- start:143 stop:670 length:528 start_codon:yes stop_codon:yes gene_type:complete